MTSGTHARPVSSLLVCLALAAVLLPGSAFPASPSSSSDQQALIEQLQGLREEIKTLRQEMRQLRGAVRDMKRPAAGLPKSTPPGATIDVVLGDGPKLGAAEATVGIVEFTDFQCPFCKKFHDQTFPQVKTTYIDTGKVQYFVRDFPLGFHAQAKPAAIAADCAGKQGTYWPMHHELFTNQKRLGPELYQELADSNELDMQDYLACLDDPERAKSVEADFAYGKSIGVRGTPNFFIGRIQDGKLLAATRISGAQSFPKFKQLLDSFLE